MVNRADGSLRADEYINVQCPLQQLTGDIDACSEFDLIGGKAAPYPGACPARLSLAGCVRCEQAPTFGGFQCAQCPAGLTLHEGLCLEVEGAAAPGGNGETERQTTAEPSSSGDGSSGVSASVIVAAVIGVLVLGGIVGAVAVAVRKQKRQTVQQYRPIGPHEDEEHYNPAFSSAGVPYDDDDELLPDGSGCEYEEL